MIAFTIILLTCIVAGLAYFTYLKIDEYKQIKQVITIQRGENSERKAIYEIIKAGIDPRAIFHDLYIAKPNGEYTQIDLAVATRSGLIIFEIKDFSGWIFGNENQKYWTQVLSYGKEKHRFYNPIMQNSGHINAIQSCLKENPNIPIFSVIVFYGNCELKKIHYNSDKTYIIYPNMIESVVSHILRQPQAEYGNKYEIMNIMTNAVNNGNNPSIVHSQINSARYYSNGMPQSSYKFFYQNFRLRNPFNRRF